MMLPLSIKSALVMQWSSKYGLVCVTDPVTFDFHILLIEVFCCAGESAKELLSDSWRG